MLVFLPFPPRKQEQWSKSRSKADEERYYQSLNLMHPTFAQAPPTAEDFAVPLPGRPAVEDAVDGGADGDADGAAPAASEDAGPTLADKLKGDPSTTRRCDINPQASTRGEGIRSNQPRLPETAPPEDSTLQKSLGTPERGM